MNVDGIAAGQAPRRRQNAPPKTATIDLGKAPEPAAQTRKLAENEPSAQAVGLTENPIANFGRPRSMAFLERSSIFSRRDCSRQDPVSPAPAAVAAPSAGGNK